ncbi:MAG: hypothetical protein WC755_04085 [Candidatus Woesearchaeota archaeon]|jgi:endonuclease YncB( thermonuclease family)
MITETEVQEVLDIVVERPIEESFYCKKVSKKESNQMYEDIKLPTLERLKQESERNNLTQFSKREKQIIDYYITLESSHNAQEQQYANTAKAIVERVLDNKILEETNRDNHSKKTKLPKKNSILDDIVDDKTVHGITDRQDLILKECKKRGFKIFECVENGETKYRGNGIFVPEKELGHLANELKSYPFIEKVKDEQTLAKASQGYKRTLNRLINTYLPVFPSVAYQS